MNNTNLTYSLLKLGIRLGIFSHISQYKKSATISSVPNSNFLTRYLNASQRLGLLKKRNGSYVMGSFTASLSQEDLRNMIPEFITMYDDIAAMAHYRAISSNHPNVLMSFGKDADVWDIFLYNPFCDAYREIIATLMSMKNGDRVLDVGCGSISPVYFANQIRPNGCYRGIEKSKGLAKIANDRLRTEGMDWAEVKNMDFEDASVYGKYDYVICTNVINYFDNIKKGVKNMLASLAPGGKAIFFDKFPDLMDFDTAAYEFYDSLTRSFKGLTTSRELSKTIMKFQNNVEISCVGSTFLIVEKL